MLVESKGRCSVSCNIQHYRAIQLKLNAMEMTRTHTGTHRSQLKPESHIKHREIRSMIISYVYWGLMIAKLPEMKILLTK